MPLKSSVTFLRQAVGSFHTTGAVAPSSPFLAQAMVKQLPHPGTARDSYRVLEVGPGTGVFTAAIVKRLAGRGRLDLWEINPKFAALLHRRVHKDDCFKGMRNRIRIHEGDVRSLPLRPMYDAVLSGLPFNNFTSEEVLAFLERFRALLKPDGVLSFFEYLGVRRVQARFAPLERRRRLRGVGRTIKKFAREHQLRQDIVPLNLPPARVRHFRFAATVEQSSNSRQSSRRKQRPEAVERKH